MRVESVNNCVHVNNQCHGGESSKSTIATRDIDRYFRILTEYISMRTNLFTALPKSIAQSDDTLNESLLPHCFVISNPRIRFRYR